MPTLSHFSFPYQMPAGLAGVTSPAQDAKTKQPASVPLLATTKDPSPSRSRFFDIPWLTHARPRGDTHSGTFTVLSCVIPRHSPDGVKPIPPYRPTTSKRHGSICHAACCLGRKARSTLDHCGAAPTKARGSGVSPPPRSGTRSCRPNFESLGIPLYSTTHPTHIGSCGVPACLREGGPLSLPLVHRVHDVRLRACSTRAASL